MLAHVEVPVPDDGFRFRTLPGGGFAAHHVRWVGLAATGETEQEAALRLMEAIEQSLMASISTAMRLSECVELDPN